MDEKKSVEERMDGLKCLFVRFLRDIGHRVNKRQIEIVEALDRDGLVGDVKVLYAGSHHPPYSLELRLDVPRESFEPEKIKEILFRSNLGVYILSEPRYENFLKEHGGTLKDSIWTVLDAGCDEEKNKYLVQISVMRGDKNKQ